MRQTRVGLQTKAALQGAIRILVATRIWMFRLKVDWMRELPLAYTFFKVLSMTQRTIGLVRSD
jgi:hypothetical protein